MANSSSQGNSEAPSYPANTCNSVYVYVSSSCSTVAVGCVLYYDLSRTITMPAGTYKVEYASNNKWQFTVNASGVVTAISRCSWSSNQVWAPLYTGQKNDCGANGLGSTVYVNDGGAYSYSGSGSVTSYTSQADADSQALTAAMNNFNAGIQGYINSVGSCTYTASNISASYTGYFTKNNCGTNCYGSGSVPYGNTQYGSATSSISYQAAYDSAYASALANATAIVNANGQNHANSTGSCCCWVSDPTCSGCNRLGNRERNNCTGEYRNTDVTAYNSCDCGPSCAGTTWSAPYCNGTTTKYRDLVYICNGGYAGTTETMETCSSFCGANSSPSYTPQNYTSCYNCYDAPVFKDTNGCSGTPGQYYIENQAGTKIFVGGQPTGGGCYTGSNCQDTGSPYCSGANWVINRYQANSCSQDGCASPRVIEYNSQTNGCYTPPPPCYTYNIIRYTTSGNVTGSYTTCAGNTSSFDLTRYDGLTGSVGTLCAQQGSVSINSGNGQVQSQGSCTA